MKKLLSDFFNNFLSSGYGRVDNSLDSVSDFLDNLNSIFSGSLSSSLSLLVTASRHSYHKSYDCDRHKYLLHNKINIIKVTQNRIYGAKLHSFLKNAMLFLHFLQFTTSFVSL